MDGYTFVVDMTKALVWPACVGIVTVVFREQLRTLLVRLRHVEATGLGSADFNDTMDEIEENVLIAGASAPVEEHADAENPLTTEYITKRTSEAARVVKVASTIEAGVPPAWVILDAWKDIEARLLAISATEGLFEQNKKATAFDIAGKMGLPKETQQAVAGLNNMRNAVAHAVVEPTRLDAMRYSTLANEVLALLNQTKREHK